MEIDKIKRVVLGKASWEEREGVRLWMEGSKAREIFLHDAKRYNGYPETRKNLDE